MPEGHDTIIEVSNIMSFVLYTQILKQSILKPASPGITLNIIVLRAFSTLQILYRTVPYRGWLTLTKLLPEFSFMDHMSCVEHLGRAYICIGLFGICPNGPLWHRVQ